METSAEGIGRAVKDFYQQLYASQVQVPFDPGGWTEECPDFMESELRSALSRMKTDKAPGEDGITVEMMNASADRLLPLLTGMLNRYLNDGYIDDELVDSATILLFKKGDPSLLKNYRPISLLSSISKLFTRTICTRIEQTMEREQGDEQAGFRAGFSTTEHIMTLCELIERTKEYPSSLYICFVDFEKAFDSVERNSMWKALESQGVHPKINRLLQNIYLQQRNTIILNNDQRVEVDVQRGVRQGDPISPILFNAALEDIFRRLNWGRGGLSINGRPLTHLRFADDIIIVSRSLKELRRRLRELSTEAARSGMKINEAKTEWMSNSTEIPLHPPMLNGKVLKKTESYVYLGRHISMPLDLKSEIRRRIRAGWLAYKKVDIYLTARHVPMKQKRMLFNQTILPAMLYGCETWTATAEHLRMLRVAQRRIERRMAGTTLFDHMTNEHLRAITGVKDLVVESHRRKRAFAWRIAQMDPERWCVQMMNWRPYGVKRPAGRPRTRWQDELRHSGAGANWLRGARERTKSRWMTL